MFVENVVVRVAGNVCTEAGKSDVLVRRGDEVGNFYASQVRFAETVFHEKKVLLGSVEEALNLISADLLLRRKDRILLVAFSGERDGGLPR